jgi:hypothetical protein
VASTAGCASGASNAATIAGSSFISYTQHVNGPVEGKCSIGSRWSSEVFRFGAPSYAGETRRDACATFGWRRPRLFAPRAAKSENPDGISCQPPHAFGTNLRSKYRNFSDAARRPFVSFILHARRGFWFVRRKQMRPQAALADYYKLNLK